MISVYGGFKVGGCQYRGIYRLSLLIDSGFTLSLTARQSNPSFFCREFDPDSSFRNRWTDELPSTIGSASQPSSV
jgi:hypothetical protein